MMDGIKLGLLVAFMLFLVWLGKRTTPPPPDPNLLTPEPSPTPFPEHDEARRYEDLFPINKTLPTVGNEIPFPFNVDELESEFGTDFVRLRIINYYFRSTDLATGPSNPTVFYDELTVDFESYVNQDVARWESKWDVATPGGIKKFFDEGGEEFLYGEALILVARYDLKTILKAALIRHCEPNDPLTKPQAENADT
jgi:hypothetical protein